MRIPHNIWCSCIICHCRMFVHYLNKHKLEKHNGIEKEIQSKRLAGRKAFMKKYGCTCP